MKEISKELQLRKIEKNKQMYFSKAMRLGKGAFGEVFLGFDDASHTPFACKIISLEKINSQQNQEALIKKIKDEIVNMQIARNEHIVEFYQAKTSERNIYILCEYCNGDNLERYLKNRGYLTEPEALTFFREILQGFYNLREKNIVHRDIKPANLLMHNYSLRIADLGFSKCIDNHEQLLESIVGSPLYMSPQIFERKKYTEKTDIWSLGAIFYEMLYGKSPFAGCTNLMELKQRVKKDISFPLYPYVSADTKKMIKKIMVVEERDRIDWEFLFNKYLLQPSIGPIQLPQSHFYTINYQFYVYFRRSYFIQSHQQLHKILKTINLCTEQQLNKSYPLYQTSEQFFTQTYFCTTNKGLIEEYFNYFIQRRNQISYLIVLCRRLGTLMGSMSSQQLWVFTYCIYELVYKYAFTLLEEMITNEDKIVLFDLKFETIRDKFCYQRFLVLLLVKDRELLRGQFDNFTPHFRSMMSGLTQSNAQLLATIQTDLSGIYSSSEGDKRVIKFFLRNYLKKVHNVLKQVILVDNSSKVSQMVNESEQNEDKQRLPPLSVTVCRLIQQYLKKNELFSLKVQNSNRNVPNITNISFRKNLNQILYDCQTTLQQKFFKQLSISKPFEEESIISFMSKEIKWNNMFIPNFL